MRQLYTTLGLCLALVLLAGADQSKSDSENLVANGDFEQGISPWHGVLLSSDDKRDNSPGLVKHETEDTADDSEGALHILIDDLGSDSYANHQSGILCQLTQSVAKDTTLRVTFDAKHLKGSPYINIKRTHGGGGSKKVVKTTDQWKSYQMPVHVDFETPSLLWSTVQGPRGAASRRLAISSVLIDNVRISKAQAK